MGKYIEKYWDAFALIIIFVVCGLGFFYGIGSYALMDVDETRYVSMARDMFLSKNFLTLYLNHEYFFEKPPLYFWSECLSFGLFGHINEFTARFATAFYALLATLAVYFTGRKVVSAKFGFVSALILATSLEFVILARFAILDIIVSSLVGISVLCGFLTQFVKDEHKKYFWWLFYLFIALAVMSKGILGFAVPCGIMFFVSLFNKTFKKCFTPSYIIPGILLFLMIVLPWHVIMLKTYDPLFFNEYIMKHHINRFFSSSEIGREQPFYFYIPMILWGAMPHAMAAIFVGIEKIKNWQKINFSDMTQGRKFLWFNIIAFVFIFLFFSVSKTKLMTYILPIYVFLANIMGYLWYEYIYEKKHTLLIDISSYLISGIFILTSLGGCFMKYYLPENLYADISSIQWFCVKILIISGVALLVFTKLKNRMCAFMTLVLFIACLSGFGTKIFYQLNYAFGQQDLLDFAKQEKEAQHDLYVVNNPRKYSVLYYGDRVHYIFLEDEDCLPDELYKGTQIYNENSRAIIRNKEYEKLAQKYDMELLQKKRKYSLVKIKSLK